MYIGWHQIRVIERADPQEAHPFAHTAEIVIAPDRNPAAWASGDDLSLTTWRRHCFDFDLAGGQLYQFCFVKRIDDMWAAGLALAPTAVTGMDNQRRLAHLVSDVTASASALTILKFLGHFSALSLFQQTHHQYPNSGWYLSICLLNAVLGGFENC